MSMYDTSASANINIKRPSIEARRRRMRLTEGDMGPKTPSENAREREVFKFYQPTKLSINNAESVPQSSHDTALTAFAQLGALRLNAKRGIISLVARDYQYVTAEATKTLSLRSDAIYEGGDGLWKGEAIVKRREAPCSIAVDLFIGTTDDRQDHLLVPDLSADKRFRRMDPVARAPFMKFYVAVPLRSPKGFVIGSFCIVDDNPRDGISDAELAFMKDMSSTIMAHMEAKRAKQQHGRADSMIRGLGLYVEGKSSLREWWLNTGYRADKLQVEEKIRRGESMNHQVNQLFGIQDLRGASSHGSISRIPSRESSQKKEDNDIYSQSAVQDSPTGTVSRVPSQVPSQRKEDNDNFIQRSSQAEDSIKPNGNGPLLDANSAIMTTSPLRAGSLEITLTDEQTDVVLVLTQESSMFSQTPVPDDVGIERSYSAGPVDETSGARLQEAVLSKTLMESLARASNLIRESIAVDGVLFLDASVGTFGGGSKKADLGFRGPSARDAGALPISSSSSLHSSGDDAHKRTGQADSISPEKTCGVLAFSTSSRSSLHMHQSSKLHLGVPESLLRKLLRRYPHGKVFNFDDDGFLSASEGASDTSVEETRKSEEPTPQEKMKPRNMSREEEGKAILKVCPGARCVAFFPLWDSHKERWFVGSLAWTTDPTRVLDPEEDLTYLAAFGNSIMAEVSRLNAVTSSKMKNSFISGISHELRSPLHGVLASVEFLQDSTMSEQQQEMVSIIGFCGRTLLDTLNHVLDFTKLRNAPKHTPEPGRRNQPNVFSFSRDRLLQESISVDLRVLTEEVIEGVYVGNCFAKSSPMNKDVLIVSGHSPQTKSQASAPVIILDLEPRPNWALDIDPGAWRRLIMNIFGNALKYTEAGFIRVSLKSSDDVQSADGISSSIVTLTVADTGKGISQEFLNHQMYTPFAQEDSLAAGSGLGLSIVRHIVNGLRGSIEIESAQGSGTEVKIILPLRSSYVSLSSSASLDPLPSVQKNLRGLDVCLVGFDMFPDIGVQPKGTMSVEAKRMFSFKSSITSLLSGWFEMRALTAPTLEESTAKVSCIMESTFDEMLSAGWLGADSGTHQAEKSLLLVLRTEPYQSCPSLSHSKYDIIYVQQPIGPAKLSMTLSRYFATPQHPVVVSGKHPFETPSSSNPLFLQPPVIRRKDSPTSSINSHKLPDVVISKLLKWGKRYAPAISNESVEFVHSVTQSEVSTTNDAHFGEQPSQTHILLVEDNAVNLRLLVKFMEKLGIDYETAENGAVAVQKYQEASLPFSLVVMDISMPVMDGMEASRKIRVFERESKRARVPIVAVTGAASESSMQEAFGAGIDKFLTKPVSLKVLRQLLDEYALLG